MHYAGVLLPFLVVCAQLISADSCINNYFELEESLLNSTAILANLSNAFFPTNRQASVSVEVTYYFVGLTKTKKFRWHGSTALQLIRSDLLYYFSLLTFNVDTPKVDVVLNPMCDDMELSSSIYNVYGNCSDVSPGLELEFSSSIYDVYGNCSDVSPGLELLNRLTTNLLPYTVHRHSALDNGFNQAAESGYSVYLFSDCPSDYCIINEGYDFNTLRISLCIAFGIFEIGTTILVSLIMAYTYTRFKAIMNANNSSYKYFAWAMAILNVFLVFLLYACNVLAVYHGLKMPTQFTDVTIAFECLVAALVILPLSDFYIIYFVLLRIYCIENRNSFRINCLGYPEIIDEENQNGQAERGQRCLNILKNLSLYFSMVFALLLTQLIFLNTVYILLAVTAAPVETGSLTILYITSFFSLLAFFALILKIYSKTNFAFVNHWRNKCTAFFCLMPLLFLVLLLAAGLSMFVLFIYTYTVLIQEYRNDRGVLAFFSSFVPSVFASGVGYFWVKTMNYVGPGNNHRNDAGTQTDDEPAQAIAIGQNQTDGESAQATARTELN